MNRYGALSKISFTKCCKNYTKAHFVKEKTEVTKTNLFLNVNIVQRSNYSIIFILDTASKLDIHVNHWHCSFEKSEKLHT